MSFLHSLNPPLVHRDLKSANLLVSEKLVVKVVRFEKISFSLSLSLSLFFFFFFLQISFINI